jgi:abortive infection bacteriophage resistance protein
VDYSKPHLTYHRQLDLLASRGMTYRDRSSATQALRSIGYYRLSGYTYVFRQEGPANEDGTRGPRRDTFVPSSRLEDAIALHDFDRTLRLTLLEGLQQIEGGLRVKIGYQLGKTDPFGHLNPAALDPAACARPSTTRDGQPTTSFNRWIETYEKNLHDAEHETFVKHFTVKYDRRLPVWAATEIMTFGSLLWLYELLSARDAKRIAEDLGIRDRSLLHKYLKALNVLRNHCAHNARVWNRSTTYPPAKPPAPLTPDTLHHLRQSDADKLYYLAALTAHLVTVLDPANNWPRRFATVAKKFPQPAGMTLQNQMGFPDDWTSLTLWNYVPVNKPNK